MKISYCCISFYSYIKPQLPKVLVEQQASCISFYSYIKPQQQYFNLYKQRVVYRSIPTSNRNYRVELIRHSYVVYRSIPTSNRNVRLHAREPCTLYIVLFLHQTATHRTSTSILQGCISFYSYIKPQLLNGYGVGIFGCISFYSYIKPQLYDFGSRHACGCISFYSYIKPQPICINIE